MVRIVVIQSKTWSAVGCACMVHAWIVSISKPLTGHTFQPCSQDRRPTSSPFPSMPSLPLRSRMITSRDRWWCSMTQAGQHSKKQAKLNHVLLQLVRVRKFGSVRCLDCLLTCLIGSCGPVSELTTLVHTKFSNTRDIRENTCHGGSRTCRHVKILEWYVERSFFALSRSNWCTHVPSPLKSSQTDCFLLKMR